MPFTQRKVGDQIVNYTKQPDGSLGKPHGRFPDTARGKQRADAQMRLLWGTLNKEGKVSSKTKARIIGMAKAYGVKRSTSKSPFEPKNAPKFRIGQKVMIPKGQSRGMGIFRQDTPGQIVGVEANEHGEPFYTVAFTTKQGKTSHIYMMEPEVARNRR